MAIGSTGRPIGDLLKDILADQRSLRDQVAAGLPIDKLLEDVEAGKPGAATGQPIDTQLASLAAVRKEQAAMEAVRAELGALRNELKADIEALRTKGPGLPPNERQALMERVDKGLARAAELENRIAAAAPQLGQLLGPLAAPPSGPLRPDFRFP